MHTTFNFLKQLVIVLVAAVLCTSCARGFLPSASVNPWQQVELPTQETLSDVAFSSDRQHGWLVGRNSTLLESQDGGKTWELRTLNLNTDEEGNFGYAFNSVSFKDDEGWILGEPSILLHTTDGGTSWSRIPLSEKLPGAPYAITALAANTAEMVTNVGAIYRTVDGGKNWKALVQQAVGASRNIARSPDGKYVAVSARGSFYSTWEPGQEAWQQYNRNSSRRLQNMGFGQDGRLWLLARGGTLQFSQPNSLEAWDEGVTPEFATSWGLLDLTYRTPEEIWVAGGSGNLLVSHDDGATWEKDRDVESIPANFYKVVFLSPEQGFVLGNNGVLLRYNAASQAA